MIAAPAERAADPFTEALRLWWESDRSEVRPRLPDPLRERFTLAELSAAMELSPQQLRYSFLQEWGHSPMAEAKRGVADLMAASGLVASGVTAADYRRWCGERLREKRLRR